MWAMTLVLLIAMPCTLDYHAGQGIDKKQEEKTKEEACQLMRELIEAVKKKDVNRILTHVHPKGTYILDGYWTRDEIIKELKDKKSRLYGHLFSSEKSVKKYLENAKDLTCKITWRVSGEYKGIFVSLQSSNYSDVDWVECCMSLENGKWYFDGMFSCE